MCGPKILGDRHVDVRTVDHPSIDGITAHTSSEKFQSERYSRFRAAISIID